MSEQVKTPGPGVYPGVPMSTYHQWDAASNSRLSQILKSPAHLKAAMDEEYEETPAQRQGRVSHTAILEPDEFESRYVVIGQCDGKTKAGKRCSKNGSVYRDGASFCHQHDPAPGEPYEDDAPEVISEDERDVALAQRDTVLSRSAAKTLLTGSGEVELGVLWHDQETEVLCKGRWDRHSPEIAGGAIVDVKTTRDASRLEFERSIFNFGYFRQGGLYLSGARARKLPAKRFVIIAVEKTPPHEVAVYRLSDSAAEEGLKQSRLLLRRYAECLESGEYPGYPDRVVDVFLPPWAFGKIDEQAKLIEEAA